MRKGVKLFILDAPIILDSKDFMIKLAINKLLKFMEVFKQLIFMRKQINPCKLHYQKYDL
jgi:hypothetical protein